MSAVRVRLSPTRELSRYKAMLYDSTQFFRFGSLIVFWFTPTFPTCPTVAEQFLDIKRTSPEGNFNVTGFPSFAISFATAPAALANCPPFPSVISMLCMAVTVVALLSLSVGPFRIPVLLERMALFPWPRSTCC
ncbi:hypothetical protein S245_030001 [Arachis hypogaea]